IVCFIFFFFFSSRRRHTRSDRDWSSDVCSSDLFENFLAVIFRIPTDRINWTTSSFLIGTFVLTLTAVPLYLWYFGVDWFQLAVRSEERRVGKECRSRGALYHLNKKKDIQNVRDG